MISEIVQNSKASFNNLDEVIELVAEGKVDML